jgi:hypothetical protein
MSKLVIYHTGYGCDSGCCGHAVEVEGGDMRRFKFKFGHAENLTPEGKRDFAVGMVVKENVDDVDFEESTIHDYSMD